MRIIAFLYFLGAATASAVSAFAATPAKHYLRLPTPPPFPSLPAAVHREDSADIWRRGLGAAKTGQSVPLSIPYLYSAADFFRMKFKHTDVNYGYNLRGSHKNIH
jgi:hypothetical protein